MIGWGGRYSWGGQEYRVLAFYCLAVRSRADLLTSLNLMCLPSIFLFWLTAMLSKLSLHCIQLLGRVWHSGFLLAATTPHSTGSYPTHYSLLTSFIASSSSVNSHTVGVPWLVYTRCQLAASCQLEIKLCMYIHSYKLSSNLVYKTICVCLFLHIGCPYIHNRCIHIYLFNNSIH